MPELPEVETIRCTIAPHLLGRTILKISHSGKNLRVVVPIEEMRSELIDSTIVSLERRAKYLLLEMSNSALCIIHLGMTGNLGVFRSETPVAKHCHLRFGLSDGLELRYTDVRRFGSFHLLPPGQHTNLEETFFHTTGPEPFSDEFNPDYLHALSRNKRLAVKKFIMTNQVVAGVGNIYANESLYRAGVNPHCPVNSISHSRWEKIVQSIQDVLNHAIECGGSTISDFLNGNQESGYFQINFQVYDRAGKPCNNCGAPIQKEQLGGRASYFCPQCQSD